MASSSQHHDSNPWAQRGFVLAAAMVAVILLAGLGLLVARGGDSDGNDASQGHASSPGTSATDATASSCGLPAGSQEVPQTPPDTTWKLVGKIAAPDSETIGPAREKGVLRTCYAHSPTGALLAAANFIAVASVANTDDSVIRALTADTGARDALPDDAKTSDSGTRAQIAGFRIVGASRDQATVELAFNVAAHDGRRGVVGMSLPMRWEKGDWKFVVAAGSDPYRTQALDNTGGYVPWGGA